MTKKPQPTGREAAVRALKKFARANWIEVDESFGDTLANETDRGVIILTATAVEDVLEYALQARMVDLNSDERARIFDADAPLGSFSARIRMAHALGIIDREQRAMCDLIRDMRNACAHSRRALSFRNKELRNVLFAAMRYIFEDEPSEDLDVDPLFYRLQFTWVCSWLTRAIRTGSKDDATALVQEALNRMRAGIDRELALQKKRPELTKKGRPPRRKD